MLTWVSLSDRFWCVAAGIGSTPGARVRVDHAAILIAGSKTHATREMPRSKRLRRAAPRPRLSARPLTSSSRNPARARCSPPPDRLARQSQIAGRLRRPGVTLMLWEEYPGSRTGGGRAASPAKSAAPESSGLSIGGEPGVDQCDRLIDDRMAHIVLRADQLHEPVRPLDIRGAVVERAGG
jgi:hypothetical protein